MSMTFFTENLIAGMGRCVSRVSMDGSYNKIGPLFFVSMIQRSLNVSLLKYDTHGRNSSVSEKQIVKQIEDTIKPLFTNFEDVMMIYVTHESPDTISFILGDDSNTLDLEFHRPTITIEQLFGLDEEIDIKDTKESSTMVELWKNLGLFILYIVLSYAAIFGVKVLFAKNLSRTNPAKKSVNIRIGYSFVRFVLRIIVIGVGLFLWVVLLVSSMEVNKYIAITVICGGGGLLLRLLSSLSLPMNFMTMKKFMSGDRIFVLYLRGFITDDYSPNMEETADAVSNARPWNAKIDSEENVLNPNKHSLNEKALAKAWKRYYQTYSVGLPEELESPEGTKRIYLDSDSWQEDAKTLMDLAKYILVCIHPNDNCIWEIRQCDTQFPEKTIYYVDDITNLGIVREKMGDDLPVCLKSVEFDQNHMMVYQKDGQVFVTSYANTESGLSSAVYAFFSM